MNSEGYFTNSDLLDYAIASRNVLLYLSNMLNMFCNDRSVCWMIGDRIKSLDSINKKIEKKKKEKGESFDPLLDLQDIAGLRVIFCDKESMRPCVDGLDKEISSWDLGQFRSSFLSSIDKAANLDIKNIYDFVDLLMRECTCASIVKDYIMFQKESGYQSIHIILDVEIEKIDKKTGEKYIRKCPVEVQFRNYTQHLYDEFEHDIRYKKCRSMNNNCDAVFEDCKTVLSMHAESFLQEIRNGEKKYLLVR